MSAGEYRQNAVRCMTEAEQLADGPTKRALKQTAACWLRLADQADKNLTCDLVYETPPRARHQSERPAPQQQQQQQIQPNSDVE